MSYAAAKGVADVLLARVPATERISTVQGIISGLKSKSQKGVKDFSSAFLAAELLQNTPESHAKDNCTDALLSAILTFIRQSEADAVSLRDPVDLCSKHEGLRRKIFERIGHELTGMLPSLCLSGQIAVPCLASELKPGPTVELSEEDSQFLVERSFRFLTFVKVCYWSEARCGISNDILKGALVLSGAASEKLSHASRDALSAFMYTASAGKSNLDGSYEEWYEINEHYGFPDKDIFWSRITELLRAPWDQGYTTTAFHIWFRWMALADLGPSQKILKQDAYWTFIQQGLREGFSETRKYCLTISRASVHLVKRLKDDCHPSVAGFEHAGYEDDYAKFCTLFETILLGRYLNQVEAVLPDLRNLAWNSSVHRSWILTLLRAALRPGVQEGIRKLIGNRILEGLVPAPTKSSEDFLDFLQDSFLPWATQGNLYTGSMRRNGQQIVCAHGEKFSSFIQELYRNCIDDETRQDYTRALLAFTQSKGDYLFQYAPVYCLHGMLQASKQFPNILAVEDVPALLATGSRSGYPEVSRDYLAVCASKLIATAVENLPESLRKNPAFVAIDTQYHELQASVASPQDDLAKVEHQASLKAFVQQLRDTKYASLRGSGLVSGCSYVIKVLNNADGSKIDTEELHLSLEALWDEAETQDYPRSALMVLPEVLFHPVCIRNASEDTQELLSRITLEFQTLTYGRIYVLSPLFKALRRAYLEAPDSASFLPFEQFIVKLANHPPHPRIEFLLEAAAATKLSEIIPHRTYTSYYGVRESHGYAAIFDFLNRLDNFDLGKRILDTLLKPWAEQKVPVPMVSKWKTTMQLQVMLLLVEPVLLQSSKKEAAEYLKTLLMSLSIEPLPRIRFLLEWIIARVYSHNLGSRNDLLDELDTSDHGSPKHLASMMKVAVMVARLPDATASFSTDLATLLIPLASSPKIVVRHEAQWSFPPLFANAMERGFIDVVGNPAFMTLDGHIRALEQFSKPPPERALKWLDPIKDHNLFMLFQGGYLDIDPVEERIVSPEDFETIWAQDTSAGASAYPAPRIPLGTTPKPPSTTPTPANPPSTTSPTPPTPTPGPTTTIPLQTKGTAWQTALLAPPSQPSTRPTSLILVGSLIDNPLNLGGLSRAAEIFGAHALYLRSLDTLAHRDFTSVAVTSHHHFPIHALPPAELPDFLRRVRGEGYSVVGVEQTDRSVVLGEYGDGGDEAGRRALPRRTVLVMGSEREGVPGAVLAECDGCVEVRQVGVTRSLNVQTAAAVALFEYQRLWWGRTDG